MKRPFNTAYQIAKDEWRFWMRTKLALIVLVIGVLLTLASVISTAQRIHELDHQRMTLQTSSESTFMEQPDRHPHRMVHYGHYAFRTPSPLSTIDPGIDTYTGNVIFLEGHRQNSATFAEQRQSTGLTQFGSLSPAFTIQNIIPLIIILIGYSSVSRERESQTLTLLVVQGTSGTTIVLGKLMAMIGAVCLILLPVIVTAGFAVAEGESTGVSLLFVLGYFAYLSVWAAVVVFVSSLLDKNRSSFSTLTFVWIASCFILPRFASSTAALTHPIAGKLETDFAVLSELRKLGDGHNANDPAFTALKAKLLEEYQVDSVDQLPINFRGVVAGRSEEELTIVLNRFAEQQMQAELAQTETARLFGWLSPKVAIGTFSMIQAGTSVETHHRFLRETEALRFDFVQSLNKAHAEQLSYQDDINRNKGEEGSRKARISAENWRIVEGFKFAVASARERFKASTESIFQLLVWLVLSAGALLIAGRRLS